MDVAEDGHGIGAGDVEVAEEGRDVGHREAHLLLLLVLHVGVRRVLRCEPVSRLRNRPTEEQKRPTNTCLRCALVASLLHKRPVQ